MNDFFYVIMYFKDGSTKLTEHNTLNNAEKFIFEYEGSFVYCEIVLGTCLKRVFYEEIK